MRRQESQRWALLSGVWALALGLVGWNSFHSQELLDKLEDAEKLRIHTQYLAQFGEDIRETADAHSQLTHEVHSAELGILAASERLRAEASILGIKEVKITVPAGDNDQKITITTVALCSFEQLVGWLNALERTTPYLEAQSTKATISPDGHNIQMEVEFSYSLEVMEPKDASDTEMASTAGGWQ